MKDLLKKILQKEKNHNHRIYIDKFGKLRWEEDDEILKIYNKIQMNDIIIFLRKNNIDKSSDIYRALYRSIGYSIYGYWEIFYWDMNNPECDDYKCSEMTEKQIRKELIELLTECEKEFNG